MKNFREHYDSSGNPLGRSGEREAIDSLTDNPGGAVIFIIFGCILLCVGVPWFVNLCFRVIGYLLLWFGSL